MSEQRAQQIANMAPAERPKLCTDGEWRGYLWRLHSPDDNRPTYVGAKDGIAAAEILLERDRLCEGR